jgi:23S rRNA (pseudouridine1915-N3)-methyltransferase
MKLHVLAVGRLKAGPEKLLCEDYQKRAEGLGRKVGITRMIGADASESQAPAPAARLAEERRFFLDRLPERAFAVVLDERGTSMASPAFAGLIRRHIDGGTADLAFLIGGPDGHAAETRDAAGLVLSLGAMTWPHRLVRVMLFEQLYRALTILTNHPYHRA